MQYVPPLIPSFQSDADPGTGTMLLAVSLWHLRQRSPWADRGRMEMSPHRLDCSSNRLPLFPVLCLTSSAQASRELPGLKLPNDPALFRFSRFQTATSRAGCLLLSLHLRKTLRWLLRRRT